ncbi:hypothetical protein ACJX0J_017562 [Zea mays]
MNINIPKVPFPFVASCTVFKYKTYHRGSGWERIINYLQAEQTIYIALSEVFAIVTMLLSLHKVVKLVENLYLFSAALAKEENSPRTGFLKIKHLIFLNYQGILPKPQSIKASMIHRGLYIQDVLGYPILTRDFHEMVVKTISLSIGSGQGWI